MGSGLILFVLVGIWLAVLVPMGLRAPEGQQPSRTAARLGSAVRVLRRRSGAAAQPARAVGVRARLGSVLVTGAGWLTRLLAVLRGQGRRLALAIRRVPHAVRLTRDRLGLRASLGMPVRGPRSAGGRSAGTRSVGARSVGARSAGARSAGARSAVRRRRCLAVALTVALGCLVGGLLGPRLLLVLAGLAVGVAALVLRRGRRVAVRRAAVRRTLGTAAPMPGVAARTAPAGPVARPEPSRPEPPVTPVEPAVQEPAEWGPARQEPAVVVGSGVRQPAAVGGPGPRQPRRLHAVPDEPVAGVQGATRRQPVHALGRPWQPVPVPPPLYARHGVAPAPAPLPASVPAAASVPADLAVLDPGGEATATRPRAVGDW